MENVRKYLLSCRQSQKMYFDRAHGTCDLIELGSGQEVLFRSPGEDEYIPRTIIKQATMSCSYIVEAQGKRYHRTREHVWAIHLIITSPAQPKPLNPQPKPSITHIPKPNPKSKHTPGEIPLPNPSAKAPITFPILQSHILPNPLRLMQLHLSKTFFNTYPPQTLSPAVILHLRNSECPQHLHQHQPHLSHQRMP